MLRYRQIKSQFFTDTFFLTAKAKSTRGYTNMQIFVSDKGYVKVYPMKSLTKYPSALRQFAKEVGAPDILVANPHKSHASKEVMDFATILAQHYVFWNKKLNGRIVLNYTWA